MIDPALLERQSPPCVAPTWPEWVTNEDGVYWVRLDREPEARALIGRIEYDDPDGHVEFDRIGRHVMVRDHRNYEEDGLEIADPLLEHDDAAVYVAFWTWA